VGRVQGGVVEVVDGDGEVVCWVEGGGVGGVTWVEGERAAGDGFFLVCDGVSSIAFF
jgi:hypothetical protein